MTGPAPFNSRYTFPASPAMAAYTGRQQLLIELEEAKKQLKARLDERGWPNGQTIHRGVLGFRLKAIEVTGTPVWLGKNGHFYYRATRDVFAQVHLTDLRDGMLLTTLDQLNNMLNNL